MTKQDTPDWAESMIKQLTDLNRRLEVQNRLTAFGNLGPDHIADISHLGDPFKMFLPYGDRDYIQRQIINARDFYESRMLQGFRAMNLVKPGGVIIDAGANIGNHTVYFNHYFAPKRMYCFEPQSAVFEILCRNIELNAATADIRPQQTLLGAAKGQGSLANYKQGNHGAAAFAEAEDGETPMISLDEAVLRSDHKKVSFIKMDVEGFQNSVVKGADSILGQGKPVLWIEVGVDERASLDALLEPYGYTGEPITKNNIIYQAG